MIKMPFGIRIFKLNYRDTYKFQNIKEHIENQLQSDMHTKYQTKGSTKSKKIY